jgi:CRISPR-associated protein Csx17
VNLSNRAMGAVAAATHEYELRGIGVQPLGNYLAGLGLLRLVNRTIDLKAKGFWRGGSFWLQTETHRDELVPRLVDSYTALHIINPWNKAAGITVDDGVAKFTGLFDGLRNSPCDRLNGLSALLDDVLEVVGIHPIVKNAIDKPAQVGALRSRIPDSDWREWCDSAIVEVLETDKKGKVTEKLKYPALLGTGGNVGATDLAVNYYDAFGLVFDITTAQGTPVKLAMEMFTEAIFGGSTRAATSTEGCKGAHMFPVNDFHLDLKRSNSLDYVESGGSGGAAVNPVLVLLATEGFLTFSSTISTIKHMVEEDGVGVRAKTQVAKYSLAVPTKGSSFNLVSVSERQNYTEEYFLPLWPMPLTHGNLVARLFQSPLLNEAGFSLRRRPGDGTDFINEVREWAVKTGATGQLLRYTMLARKGQNNFAVYLGVVEVGGDLIDLAADMNPVRGKLRSAADKVPATVSSMIYQFDRLYSEFAERDRADLLHLLGKISRHPDVGWCFRELKLRGDWVAGYENEIEFRLAVALNLKGTDVLNGASPIGSMVTILKERSRKANKQTREQLNGRLNGRSLALLADVDRFIRGDIDLQRFVLWTEALKYVSTGDVRFDSVSAVTARLPEDYRVGVIYIAEFGMENCMFMPHCVQRLMGMGVMARSRSRLDGYDDRTLAALLFPIAWEERQSILRNHFICN